MNRITPALIAAFELASTTVSAQQPVQPTDTNPVITAWQKCEDQVAAATMPKRGQVTHHRYNVPEHPDQKGLTTEGMIVRGMLTNDVIYGDEGDMTGTDFERIMNADGTIASESIILNDDRHVGEDPGTEIPSHRIIIMDINVHDLSQKPQTKFGAVNETPATEAQKKILIQNAQIAIDLFRKCIASGPR